MIIRKKSKEELLNQAEWFLEYAKENWKLDKKTEREISKILWLNEDEKRWFLERLSSKFWKELDISDKWEIEKTLKRKHIDFDKLWKEYEEYLSLQSEKKHNIKRVEKFFEPYKTSDDIVNKEILKVIIENYSENTLEKMKIFLMSNFYKEIYVEWKVVHESLSRKYDSLKCGVEQVLRYFVIERNSDDLKILLQMESFDLVESRNSGLIYSINFDILRKNIKTLNEYGHNQKKYTLSNFIYEDFEPYIKILEDFNFEWFWKEFDIECEDEFLKTFLNFKNLTKESLLKKCLSIWLKGIQETLSICPDISYENSSCYTSKFVHMFWNDVENRKRSASRIRQIVGIGADSEFLAYLWTVYWTNNWEKNIDLMFEKWYLWTKEILPYDEYICGDWWNNREIAILKLIDNNVLKLLTKNIKSQNDFKVLIDFINHAKQENLKIIFEQYPDIRISELTLLENENTHILYSAEPENLKIISEQYPDISVSELITFKNIVCDNSKELLQQINNFWSTVPTSKSLDILDLFDDDTKKHDEIFENIENKEEINDKNWIYIVWLYSAIEYFEDDKSISDEIKSTIRPLFQNKENKNFIYEKLTELLNKSLSADKDLTDEEIALLAVLNKKWLANMWQSESLAKFIYWINKLGKNYDFVVAFGETKWEILKFVDCHRKNLNELMTLFYEISIFLLEKSPSIYRNLMKLLNMLDSEQQERFCREIFPLYNVELFLWEGEWKYKLLWTYANNNVEAQLIPMHERIKELLNNIKDWENRGINSLLNNEKSCLVNNVKKLFKEKFWIKKIPPEFTKENIESIEWHSIYLSNMNGVDEEKTAVLWYFLSLKLNGNRSEFRAWKYFDPSEYMDSSKVSIINDYLSKRSDRKDICKLYDVNENDMKILQENESNIIMWNTNWIMDRLKTIESNVKTLLDEDVYTGRQKIIKSYIDKGLWKDLWRLLFKQFKILLGQNIPLNDEEKKMLSTLIGEFWSDIMNSKEKVGELQMEYKWISEVINFVNKILENDLQKEVQDFVDCCIPSEENLRLLKKIWINLEDRKMVSSNAFLSFIDGKIETAKKEGKLTEEEYKLLSEYMVKVHKELDDLYAIKDRLMILYKEMEKYIDNFKGTELEQRFKGMSPCFFTKADVEKKNIVSLMTNDMDIVIKNIRQCLRCRGKWCNNDTDLSFGCNDRFFITTSHREWDTSFADELVTLLPRVPNEEWFSFVMDKIYWDNGSPDVLLNNIYVILKKISKLSPELRKQLSIFVPDWIWLKLDEEWVAKIKKQYNWVNITKQDITVTVEPQPITDSYHEFGLKDCRGTWDVKKSWYLINFE